MSILMCRASDVTDMSMYFSEFCQKWSISEDALEQPQRARVPQHQCLTRQQFEEASKHWPVNYHEDKHITRAISGLLFGHDELDEMRKYMKLAIAAATHNKLQKQEPIGAVVVDAHSHTISAISCDHTCTGHPLHTAVMVCLDLVAQSQGGGAYRLGVPLTNAQLCNELKDCIRTHFSGEENFQDCMLDRWLVHEERVESTSSHQMATSGRKRKSLMAHDSEPSQPYLCTGYDLYITREPSIMCSMALVHSRIRRVFYGVVEPNRGGLGSIYKIHTQPGLNHHFEAYTGGLCEDDYDSLSKY